MICISYDGKVREVAYGGDYTQLYREGNYETFDVVRLRHGLAMYVDDEGLLKDGCENRVNWKAIYLRLNEWMSRQRDIAWNANALNACPPFIVGDVCILATSDKGEAVEPSPSQRKFILELLGEEVAR